MGFESPFFDANGPEELCVCAPLIRLRWHLLPVKLGRRALEESPGGETRRAVVRRSSRCRNVKSGESARTRGAVVRNHRSAVTSNEGERVGGGELGCAVVGTSSRCHRDAGAAVPARCGGGEGARLMRGALISGSVEPRRTDLLPAAKGRACGPQSNLRGYFDFETEARASLDRAPSRQGQDRD